VFSSESKKKHGIDDDKNGYIDDIHGWNFLGDAVHEQLEMTRIVKKGPGTPEYDKAKAELEKERAELTEVKPQYDMISQANESVKKFLKKETYTIEDLNGIKTEDKELLKNKTIMTQIGGMIGEGFVEKFEEEYDHVFSTLNYNLNVDFDGRKIVGDNPDDLKDTKYGNNNVVGPEPKEAKHGTHVAGIVAQVRGNGLGGDGVTNNAKIMAVRAVPNGDEYDKDIALGIRYAVDNGAKVINMSFGKPVSPEKELVWEAFQYAKDKGVLLVKAAGNENEDIQENPYFPTNFKSTKDEKPFINNMIVVGASTNNNEFLRAGFSNFNQKMVNVFAPGDKIYSTVPDGKYEYLQGTSMASPVVAGASAVLLAYMPNLKPEQVIESLVKSVNKSEVNAMLPTNTNNRFDLISESGGVIDLYKAAQYAYTHFYKAAPAKPVKKAVVKKKKVVRKK